MSHAQVIRRTYLLILIENAREPRSIKPSGTTSCSPHPCCNIMLLHANLRVFRSPARAEDRERGTLLKLDEAYRSRDFIKMMARLGGEGWVGHQPHGLVSMLGLDGATEEDIACVFQTQIKVADGLRVSGLGFRV